MQQKGEREIMTNGECCRYIRTYSELEGLQHACTLVYCAASTPQGVLAQLRREQGGRVRSSTVLAPADSFGRIMRLLRYLCENGVGPEQWLEVLEDVHQPYQLLDTSKNAMNMAEEPVFFFFFRFKGHKLRPFYAIDISGAKVYSISRFTQTVSIRGKRF